VTFLFVFALVVIILILDELFFSTKQLQQ